ncbi:unnamed protein product [Vicia faba]|uniref:Uncharacterized protein n=1 Tax=Vicia faba TaxID=3906 RepID=A0AAV0ZTQ4_VICFA|nr:unnamed protein product [Vicia faba]
MHISQTLPHLKHRSRNPSYIQENIKRKQRGHPIQNGDVRDQVKKDGPDIEMTNHIGPRSAKIWQKEPVKERWWMPPKKKTIANMEAKIADLEQELSLMKVAFSDSIAEVQQTARENQRALMQMMEKVLGKKVVEVVDGVEGKLRSKRSGI